MDTDKFKIKMLGINGINGKVVKLAEWNEFMDYFKITFTDDSILEIKCEVLKVYIDGTKI